MQRLAPLVLLLLLPTAAATETFASEASFGPALGDPFVLGGRIVRTADGEEAAAWRHALDVDMDGTVTDGELLEARADEEALPLEERPHVRVANHAPVELTTSHWEIRGALGPADATGEMRQVWVWSATYPALRGSPIELVYHVPGHERAYLNLTLSDASVVESARDVVGAGGIDGAFYEYRGRASGSAPTLVVLPDAVRWSERYHVTFDTRELARASVVRGFVGADAADRRGLYDADDDGEVTEAEVAALRGTTTLPGEAFPFQLASEWPTRVEVRSWTHIGPLVGPTAAQTYFVEETVLAGTFRPFATPTDLNLSARGLYVIGAPPGTSLSALAGLSNVTLGAGGDSITAERRGLAPGLVRVSTAASAPAPAPSDATEAPGASDPKAPGASPAPEEDLIADEPEGLTVEDVVAPTKANPAGKASGAVAEEAETPGAPLALLLVALVVLARLRRGAS